MTRKEIFEKYNVGRAEFSEKLRKLFPEYISNKQGKMIDIPECVAFSVCESLKNKKVYKYKNKKL